MLLEMIAEAKAKIRISTGAEPKTLRVGPAAYDNLAGEIEEVMGIKLGKDDRWDTVLGMTMEVIEGCDREFIIE